MSNYENKVYLSLLESPFCDAKTVSTKSGVPYGRIYDTLETLESKKLIIVKHGRPKTYTVIEPELAVSRLMSTKQNDLRELEKQAELTTQNLNKLYERKPKDQLVWKAAIGEELMPTYFNFMMESRKEFLTFFQVDYTELTHTIDFSKYYEVIQQLMAMKVTVKIILGFDDFSLLEELVAQRPEYLQFLSLADVRYTDKKRQSFSIIDKEKVILKVVNPVNDGEMLAGIYLWQQPLAVTLRSAFLELWEECLEPKIGIQLG